MIAAIVVPFGCRSIRSTASCFDEAPVDLAEPGLDVAAWAAVDDRAGLRFPAEDGAVRDCLVIRFADFDFVLLVAIRLSLISATASGAATGTSPAFRRGR